MKREDRSAGPQAVKEINVDIDLLQLAPMSVYSMLAFDRYSERLESETFDPRSSSQVDCVARSWY